MSRQFAFLKFQATANNFTLSGFFDPLQLCWIFDWARGNAERWHCLQSFGRKQIILLWTSL